MEDPQQALDRLADLIAKARRQGADAADAVLVGSVALSNAQRLGALERLERQESEDLGLRVLVGRRQAIVSSTDTSAEALVKRLLGTNRSAAVSYGTEAGFFQQSAFSTVICGPGRIEQAHKPDEYLEMAQLAACERFLSDLAGALATGDLVGGNGT